MKKSLKQGPKVKELSLRLMLGNQNSEIWQKDKKL